MCVLRTVDVTCEINGGSHGYSRYGTELRVKQVEAFVSSWLGVRGQEGPCWLEQTSTAEAVYVAEDKHTKKGLYFPSR